MSPARSLALPPYFLPFLASRDTQRHQLVPRSLKVDVDCGWCAVGVSVVLAELDAVSQAEAVWTCPVCEKKNVLPIFGRVESLQLR